MDATKIANELTTIAGMVSAGHKRKAYADIEDVREEFGKDTEKLLDALDIDPDEVSKFEVNPSGYYGDWYIYASRVEEFIGFNSYDDAERVALKAAEEHLYDDGGAYQSLLQQFLTMTDTDRRIMASDHTDSYVELVEDEELLEEASMLDDYEELTRWHDDAMAAAYDGEFEVYAEQYKWKDEDDAEDAMKEYATEMEVLVDKAREAVMEARYDYVYDALSDPVEYFVEETGLYDVEDLMKANFIMVDYKAAAEEMTRYDGIAGWLGGDFGDGEISGPKNTVWFRQN